MTVNCLRWCWHVFIGACRRRLQSCHLPCQWRLGDSLSPAFFFNVWQLKAIKQPERRNGGGRGRRAGLQTDRRGNNASTQPLLSVFCDRKKKSPLMEISPSTPQLFAGQIHPALFSFAVEVVANVFPIYQCDRHSVLVCFTQQGKLITHLL